jgi:hypothetical protein
MDATVLEENYRRTPTVLGHRLVGLLRAVTVTAASAVTTALLLMVMLVAEAAAAGAPHTGWQGSRWRGDRGGRGHADSHVIGASRGGYDACRRIEEI